LRVPAVFFGSQPILSLYSSNHKTGIILESGEGITQCCVAFESFAIPHSYIRYDFGGRNVTEYLQTLLRRCGHNFNTTSEFEIVRKIKEETCYALLSSTSSDGKNNERNEHEGNKYHLPDGNFVAIRDEKVMAPEILFDPLRIGLENLFKIFFCQKFFYLFLFEIILFYFI
jgi:centractin